MAKNPIRALRLGTAAARSLCTAAAAAASQVKGSGKAGLKPLYHRLSALGAGGGGSVAETMDEWIKEGRAAGDSRLIGIVWELRKYKNDDLALQLMDWMETRGLEMSTGKYALRLGLIAKVKGMDSAEVYFSSLPDSEKNLRTYGTLLECYCRDKAEHKAITLYGKMKELKIASDTFVNNNLLSLYMKLGQPDKVQALFQEAKANKFSPDVCTYNILMNSYASVNDLDSIEQLIDEMKARRLTLDWTTYANLAGIYNSAGLPQKAEPAIKMAEELMDKHNKSAFHSIISLYAGAGNKAEVTRLWNSLKATFTKTTNMSYHVMLQALSKLDDMDALKQCFDEWEANCKSYDMRLVNVMIGAYLRKDMMKEAESLCKKAIEKGVGSDIRTLELFMDYFIKRNEMDLALKFFHVAVSQAKESQWKPDKEKLSAFLKYFHEVKDADGAEAFCNSLKKLNCVEAEAYEPLFRTYVAADEE